MPWLTLLRLFLSAASSIAELVKNKQLMDAGAAKAVLRGIKEADDAIRKARDARANVSHDPDSVRDDPHNRDRGRGLD